MEAAPVSPLPKEAQTWGMLAHLSALGGYVIPFGNLVGPLLVWQLKKEVHPFVEQQGKEALNFQISMLIYAIVAAILIFVLVGLFLLVVLAAANLILIILATVKANKGEPYRYPMTFRIIR